VKPKKAYGMGLQNTSVPKINKQKTFIEGINGKSSRALRSDLENLCTFVESPNSMTHLYGLRQADVFKFPQSSKSNSPNVKSSSNSSIEKRRSPASKGPQIQRFGELDVHATNLKLLGSSPQGNFTER
jgi:hypothetical protein